MIALLGAPGGLLIGDGAVAASSMPPRTAAIGAAAAPHPRLHVHITFSYRVVGNVTRIRAIAFSGLPFTAQVSIRCRGRGCFHQSLHKNVFNLQEAVRFVRHRTFRAGQRLIFTFSAPSYSSVTFVLRMIYNNDPRLTVLKPTHRTKRRPRGSRPTL